MNINNNQYRSIADNASFVSLIKEAIKDEEIKKTIEIILNLPVAERKIVINKLTEKMKRESVSSDFIEAITSLADEDIANKVREVLKI